MERRGQRRGRWPGRARDRWRSDSAGRLGARVPPGRRDLLNCRFRGDTIGVYTTPALLSHRAWRAAVLARDRHRCRWCGSGVDLHVHHVLDAVRCPELARVVENGLTLCGECHYYEAHNGWPAWIHGRYAVTRRPFPGQLELFGRWPGPLFGSPLATRHSPLLPPPIGSTWPGPQCLLFPLDAGLYAGVR